jgi:hypothetical protein
MVEHAAFQKLVRHLAHDRPPVPIRRGKALFIRVVKCAEVIADEAKEGRGLRAPRFVEAQGRAGRDRGHCARHSEAQERRAYRRDAGRPSPPLRERCHSNACARGLTVLAADERLAGARCARDDVTARSRSWRYTATQFCPKQACPTSRADVRFWQCALGRLLSAARELPPSLVVEGDRTFFLPVIQRTSGATEEGLCRSRSRLSTPSSG